MLFGQQRYGLRFCWQRSIAMAGFFRLIENAPMPIFCETLPTVSDPLATARALAEAFARTAVERDQRGGTPKAERDALRDSGLLRLSIPREYGGLGADWTLTMRVVRELAQADSSIGHVFAFHHLMLATVRLFGQPAQWQPWFEHTARRQWFWGNAMNPLDTRTLCREASGGHELSGKKSFCSGALDSEMLLVSAIRERDREFITMALPSGRSGISIIQDWDNIGQRQTDSGSVSFERVRVEHQEILDNPGPLSTPYACLRSLLAQLILANIYLGIAEGAFADARHYTLHEARPWFLSGHRQMADDPYILNHYGEFWMGLETVRTLADRAAALFDDAWRRQAALDASMRGEVALAVTLAKVSATRVGLDLTSRMFDVAGARATHAGLRLDRYWRNLRTHTLHDPIDYKIRELGTWALTERYPTPTFYS